MKRSPVYIVLLTVFIDLLGFGMIIPLLPFYAEHFGASAVEVGLLASSYSLMQFLFVPFWGQLSDRVGRRPIIILSVAGSFVSYFIFGLAGSLTVLFISRILSGFMGANISTANAYIADSTPFEERAKYMGMIGAAFGVGFMLGPFVGGLMSRISLGAPGFLASGLSLVNLALAYFMLPESLTEKPEHARKLRIMDVSGIRNAFRNPAIMSLVMVYFFYIIAFSTLDVAFPLFTGHRFGYDAESNGYLFAYMGLIVVLIQGGATGRLVKRFGERGLVVAGIISLFVGLALVPLAHGLWELLVLLTFLAIGSALAQPSLTSLISKSASPKEQGSVLGVSSSFTSLARVIGPFWGGFIIGTVGMSWPFYTGAVMVLVALAFAFKAVKAVKHVEEGNVAGTLPS